MRKVTFLMNRWFFLLNQKLVELYTMVRDLKPPSSLKVTVSPDTEDAF